jgi:MFS family permease
VPRSFGSQLGLLRRVSGFRLLFLATLGSGAGTWLALVALLVDITERTHSPTWVTALLIADLVPTFAIGLLVGPLVDRLSRKTLMIAADLLRFGAFCALPFTDSAAEIVALALVVGLASGFFRPAVYAAVPNLVDERDLSTANSLLQTIDNLTWAVGSIAGGALVGASGPHLAYWINAATFVISAALIGRIPQRLLQAGRAATRGHWRDLGDGFALVRESRALLTVLLAWNVAMLANAAINVAEPFLVFDAFKSGRFGLGLLMGCAGFGLAFGAFFAAQSIEARGLASVYGGSLALMALGIGAAAAAPNVWVAAACVTLSGAGNGAAVVCNALLVQRGAPDYLRGRAFTVLMSSNTALLTVGMIASGRLTEAVGPRWMWAAAAVLSAIAAGVGLVLARGVGERGLAADPEPLPAVEVAAAPARQRAL